MYSLFSPTLLLVCFLFSPPIPLFLSLLPLSLSPFPLPVIDHGIASVEVLMEEALQDIPPLVQDIQERLRRRHPYIYTHIHAHMHTPIYPYMHTTIHPYTHTPIRAYTRTVHS